VKIAVINQPFWQRIILIIVLGYEAAGAIVGSTLLILSPDGRYMKMPVELMNGVFRDYLLPGIILFLLGILTAVAFVTVIRQSLNDWLVTSLAIGGFYIWFVVEIIVLKELHWLHLMWGVPVLLGMIMTFPLIAIRNESIGIQKGLVMCGILSSLWYFVINLVVPLFYEGYSHLTFTVSELSAIAAPTRILWVLFVTLYLLLFAAFGWGVLQFSNKYQRLKIVGGLILLYSLFNLYWPPMHMRGESFSLTDALHIGWASATILLMMIMMAVGATVFDKKFRNYTILSIALLVVFGFLTFLEAPNISTNEPTPTIGIWERINIGIFLVWIIMFASRLLNIQKLSVKQ
jgi:hypothetical protein